MPGAFRDRILTFTSVPRGGMLLPVSQMKVPRLGEIVCLVKESDPPFLRLFGMSSFSRSLIIDWGVSLRSPICSPKVETPSHSCLYYSYRHSNVYWKNTLETQIWLHRNECYVQKGRTGILQQPWKLP